MFFFTQWKGGPQGDEIGLEGRGCTDMEITQRHMETIIQMISIKRRYAKITGLGRNIYGV